MNYSNQFPRQKDKEQHVPIQKRANIIFNEIIDRKNEPNSLYNYIMKKGGQNETR